MINPEEKKETISLFVKTDISLMMILENSNAIKEILISITNIIDHLNNEDIKKTEEEITRLRMLIEEKIPKMPQKAILKSIKTCEDYLNGLKLAKAIIKEDELI